MLFHVLTWEDIESYEKPPRVFSFVLHVCAEIRAAPPTWNGDPTSGWSRVCAAVGKKRRLVGSTEAFGKRNPVESLLARRPDGELNSGAKTQVFRLVQCFDLSNCRSLVVGAGLIGLGHVENGFGL